MAAELNYARTQENLNKCNQDLKGSGQKLMAAESKLVSLQKQAEKNVNEKSEIIAKQKRVIIKSKKDSTYKDAHIRKLEKDVIRCRNKNESLATTLQQKEEILSRLTNLELVLSTIVRFFLEIILLPLATFDERSLLHTIIAKTRGKVMSPDKRLLLTTIMSIVWGGMLVLVIINAVMPGLRPHIVKWQIQLEEEQEEDSKVRWPRGIPAVFSRGGGQPIVMDPYDPIFLQIRVIRELQSQSLSRKAILSSGTLIKHIKKNISENTIILQMILWAAFCFGSIGSTRALNDPIYKGDLRVGPASGNLDSESSDFDNTIQGGISIHLPSSDTVLVKTPSKSSEVETQTSIPKSKKLRKKKRKRVGKLSDFSSQEFENAEIIESISEDLSTLRSRIRSQ